MAHDAHAARDARDVRDVHDAVPDEVLDALHFHDFQHELVPVAALDDVQLHSPAAVALQHAPIDAELEPILADIPQR